MTTAFVFIRSALKILCIAAALGISALNITAYADDSLHESEGQVLSIDGKGVKLAHGPFKTLGMAGMTMRFPLARPEVGQGLKAGDSVQIWLRETDDAYVVERLKKLGD